MKRFVSLLILSLVSCSPRDRGDVGASITTGDSLALLSMVRARETAMINRDLPAVMAQFDSSAAFINGGGYYYEASSEIRSFHRSMFENDSLTYTYRIGNILIRSLGRDFAVVYYPWQQSWTMRHVSSDTLNESGLMTLIASRKDNGWKWRAVTNQRTKEFFADLSSHKSLPRNE